MSHSTGYLKPLDSIRGIAILLVIFGHWLPSLRINKIISLGTIGVTIFFVLSGFLITRILLNNKETIENRWIIIKNFIIRRTLRIFPIYYILIITLYFFASETGTTLKQNFIYYLTYTSNVSMYLRQSWDGMLSHVWSLAVEEQFYLIWPWLLVFVNKKRILGVIISFIVIGILSFYLIPLLFSLKKFYILLSITCFDALGIGGLLAYIAVYKDIYNKTLRNTLRLLCILGLIMIFLFVYFKIPHLSFRLLATFVGVYILYFAVYEKPTFIHRYLFENRFLIFIGKISYGMYLYHMVLQWIWVKFIVHNIHINHIPYQIYSFFIIKFIILISLSWASWKLIEEPILGLKKHFEY